jgi:hypothetical protein
MVKLFAVKDGLKKAYRRCENIQFLKPAAGAAAEVALSVYGVWRPYQGKKFLILIQGRSGSSLLCDLLDSHPEVRCQSELLHGRLKAPLTYLTGMASFQPTSRAWGFKTKINQIEQQPGMRSPRELLEALHKDDWSIFSLSRKNCVHAALSRLVAWRRGNCYHNTGQAAASELGKVYLEPGRVLQAARREREERKQVQELTHGLSSLNLTLISWSRRLNKGLAEKFLSFFLLTKSRFPLSSLRPQRPPFQILLLMQRKSSEQFKGRKLQSIFSATLSFKGLTH